MILSYSLREVLFRLLIFYILKNFNILRVWYFKLFKFNRKDKISFRKIIYEFLVRKFHFFFTFLQTFSRNTLMRNAYSPALRSVDLASLNMDWREVDLVVLDNPTQNPR